MQRTVSQSIYIGGTIRSGATLLSLLLGGHPEISCLGEVYRLNYMMAEGDSCTCGVRISDCPFWLAVENTLSPLSDGNFAGRFFGFWVRIVTWLNFEVLKACGHIWNELND